MNAAPAPTESARPAVWGAWATLGFAVLIAVAHVIASNLTVLLYLAITDSDSLKLFADPDGARKLISNGELLVVSTLVTTPITVALTLLLVWARRGLPAFEYLGGRALSRGEWLRWLALTLLFVAAMDGVTWLSGRPLVPDFLRETYTSAGALPLFWLAVAVAAPLSEELFFRGFIFRGLSESRLGPWIAIVLAALVWAVIHIQYEAFYVVIIFIGGLFLGYARWRSGSLLLAIVIHAVWNLIALTEAALWLNGHFPG
jgi:membrane protease YdiL (CAAX protease family)